MASVKSRVSFTCPNCAKVLRASARPPAGKKIKCPACGEAFVPDLDEEEEEATRIQAKPSAKAKAKAAASRDDDEDDDRPRGKRSRADDDDDKDDDERPRGKRSRADEDDDDDDRLVKKKKKAAKKSGGKLMMILGGVFLVGGALLSCVLCGVGAFLWPGFLLSKNNNEMLAFVAPDANFLLGGRPKELKTKFAPFKDMFAQAAGPGGGNQIPELEDMLTNSEQILLFMNTNDFGKKMVLIARADAADIDRLKRSNKLEAAKTVGGHAMHKIKNQNQGFGNGPERVVFADGRLVILTDLDETQFVATLNRGKKDPAKSAAIDLSRSVDKSPLWLAVTFDGEARRTLRTGFDKAGQMSPAMKAAAPAVDGAKGITVTFDVTPANDIKITASMMCKNADDAAKVKTGVEEGWTMVKGLLNAAAMMGQPQPGQDQAQKLILKDLNSMSFNANGDTATGTLTFSNPTIQEMAKMMKNNPFGPGAMAFGPPPMPPNKNFGPPNKQLPTTMNVLGMPAGQMQEQQYNFPQGAKLNIDWHSHAPAGTSVTLTILEGAAGEKVLLSENQVGLGVRAGLKLNVPAAGVFRVRVRNNGPGATTGGAVFIRQE
jgi:phage FluMu protein Com